MSQPQTFFQLSGRGYAAATLKNATLLIIDAQEEYRSGALPLPGLDEAVAQIAALLQAARDNGTPVVHVKHLGIPGGLFDPQGPRGNFLPEVTPTDAEVIVEKRLPNAFANTDLHERLLGLGHLDLIVCGFMSHSSVSTTVRAAKDYGYRCTVVTSACASRDLPGIDGSVLSAAQVQFVVLSALADNFAVVVPNAQSLL
ncbi:cysteine hydrolase family protein [Pseudomonas matsuisoli]|uniref:Cysteine hydrolase n=1 Tax=Pseudomonas matsuisoli TaxID=1515666 RepID=A0A917UWT2_9PSED|nr:cysteine hydrolase family protein [Pseudomonas matsuisoli]GGJ91173.1 cysteine hydrolase [Pseudomonas matsuisoli]